MILYIDTATNPAKLILHSSHADWVFEFAEFPHSEQFTEHIQNFLRKHHVTIADLKKIAVRVGPGSFRRIRTGVVAANALAYGANLGVVGVTTDPDFDSIARQKGERMVAPIYDAEPTITLPNKKKL